MQTTVIGSYHPCAEHRLEQFVLYSKVLPVTTGMFVVLKMQSGILSTYTFVTYCPYLSGEEIGDQIFRNPFWLVSTTFKTTDLKCYKSFGASL